MFCPPGMLGYDMKEGRAKKNLEHLGKRKSTELIYIQTDPDSAINNNELPVGYYLSRTVI